MIVVSALAINFIWDIGIILTVNVGAHASRL